MTTFPANSLVRLPSFSIILETENLANSSVKGLFKSLVSLVHQDLPLTQAQEVLLIDTGNIPQQLLAQIHELYPWITVVTAPSGIGYYGAKMLGAEIATGEVVIYTDADCEYEPTWLQRILAGFIQGDNIQVVTGETATRGKGIYGTAMAMSYIFPPFSEQERLIPTQKYYSNNVAFRREFLLKYPIPVDLPLHRGNCIIHAQKLHDIGCTIWQQPQARAIYRPTNHLSHFLWQFIVLGHDSYWQNKLLMDKWKSQYTDNNSLKVRIKKFCDRFCNIFSRHPYKLLHLPLAIPIMLLSFICVLIGYVVTVIQPNLLLKQYDKMLGKS